MTNYLFIAVLISLLISLIGFFGLLWFHRMGVRGPLYVPARKSSSNAILLGGLPLAIATLVGTLVMIPLFHQEDNLNLMVRWFCSGFIIVFYGYFDDRFELRPIIKLIAQFSAVFIFAITVSPIIFTQNSSLAFVAIFLWGLGVINGTNLLDGLDGMSIKLGIVSLLSFIYLGFIFNSVVIMGFASIVTISLLAFYFFNREPAKIHLGEIGGCFIGFASLFLAALLFRESSKTVSYFSAFSYAVLPLTFPMVEVGISMLRRILNKKTPFKGDRLHVHQLLVNFYGLSASRATSYMAIVCGAIYLTAIMLARFNPFVAELATIGALTLISFLIGRKHWKTKDTIHLGTRELIRSMVKSDVLIIDQKLADDFQFSVVPKEETTHTDLIAS